MSLNINDFRSTGMTTRDLSHIVSPSNEFQNKISTMITQFEKKNFSSSRIFQK